MAEYRVRYADDQNARQNQSEYFTRAKAGKPKRAIRKFRKSNEYAEIEVKLGHRPYIIDVCERESSTFWAKGSIISSKLNRPKRVSREETLGVDDDAGESNLAKV